MVTNSITSHATELQTANNSRATATLSAHHVAWRAIAGTITYLWILHIQVTKVTWQDIGARTWCHYNDKNKKQNKSVIEH